MRKKLKTTKRTGREKRFGHLSKGERIEITEKVFIRYPRLKNLYTQIDFCRTYSAMAAESECMLVTGKQGAGKTTLIEWYASDFPIREIVRQTNCSSSRCNRTLSSNSERPGVCDA